MLKSSIRIEAFFLRVERAIARRGRFRPVRFLKYRYRDCLEEAIKAIRFDSGN